MISCSTNKEGKTKITVVFHGTECVHDLLTDANAVKNPIKRLVKLGYIHGCFRNRYVESREVMLEAIKRKLASHGKEDKDVDFVIQVIV